MKRLQELLFGLVSVVGALGLLVTTPAAQCLGPDGLNGPCWTPVNATLPSFPALTLPGSGFCWDNCSLTTQNCVDVSLSPPVPTVCGEYTVQLSASDCGTGISLLGGLAVLNYTRTWEEMDPAGIDRYQVYRFMAKIDAATFATAPVCPVPSCLMAGMPTAFMYGYVDYAFNCTTNNWVGSLVLFHNCDLFIHNPSISGLPGVFHPATTYAIVAPDTPLNPFVPSLTPPPSGPMLSEATRNVTSALAPGMCETEDPIQGTHIQFFQGCMCPLSFVPPKNQLVHMDGVGTCIDPTGLPTSFRSVALGTFPTIPWFEVVSTSIGCWTTSASYPGDECVTVEEGLFRYYDSCGLPGATGVGYLDISYGATTTSGFPVSPDPVFFLNENMVDFASNWSKAAGTPPVFPYVGFVMPSLHLMYGNTP